MIIVQNHHLSSFITATDTTTLPTHPPNVQVEIVCFGTTLPVFICQPVFGHFGALVTFTALLCCY